MVDLDRRDSMSLHESSLFDSMYVQVEEAVIVKEGIRLARAADVQNEMKRREGQKMAAGGVQVGPRR